MSGTLASLRGRIGGLALASQRDPHAYTARARAAFLDRFIPDDPDLTPEERRRRAGAARRCYFTKLAYLSAKARRGRQNGEGQ